MLGVEGGLRDATWVGPETSAEAQVGAAGFIFVVEPFVEADVGRWIALMAWACWYGGVG